MAAGRSKSVNSKQIIALRKIAATVLGHLPARREDALYVLDYARHLIGVMEEPDELIR